jgi:HPt (histidine-containing phosphotransfer) domain-containing protein
MTIDDRMAQLRQRFMRAAHGHADALESLLAQNDLEAARQLAHGLAGRSGMFGFGELGETARRVDEVSAAELPGYARELVAALRALPQGGG